jgi:Ribbon-helix-helix domain
MTPATKKHQQLILLEPRKAKLLEELSAQTRIPRQALLREAVDDLLAKHGQLESEQYDLLRRVLLESRRLAGKVIERGHEEQATADRAKRLIRDLDQIQDAYDKHWRFSIRGAVDALLTEHKLVKPKRKS